MEGRSGSIPAGADFMPGTSAEALRRLANREMDAPTAKKYMVAYHRKAGRSLEEISQIILEPCDAVGAWLAAMHNGGLEAAAPRGKGPGRGRSTPPGARRARP